MESVDQQFRQLKENYERMTDGELYALTEKAYHLTEIAREALQAVITEKGITVRLRLESPAHRPAEPPEDDEGLVNFQWPDNADHAWRWMKCLTAAGIPSFLGPDNVMHLEEFRGKFDGPVSLKIRDVDRIRALDAVARARAKARANDSNEEEEREEEKDNVDQQLPQLKENYGHMSEGQLCKLAENAYKLTDIAREALQAVVSEKGITVRLRLEPPARLLAKPLEDDEGLINLGMRGWPADAEAAWLTMGALSAAGIPSFLGPQNVVHLEEFRGKFNGLVSLKVREVDWNRASIALKKAADAGWWDKASWWDNGKEKEEGPDEEKDYAILCPKCRSAKVVMAGRETEVLAGSPPRGKFQWICDACGHQWEDEGILQEAPGGQSWAGEEFSSRRGPFRRVDQK